MIRLLLPLLLLLTICRPVHAGYSIYIAPQLPEFVQVNGPYGPESLRNTEPPPALPATYGREVCRPANYSPFVADTARRSRVFEDSAGTAVSGALFAACPQARQQKEAQIRAEGDRRLKTLAGPYMDGERETWGVQMKEAEEYLFDPVNTQTPMLSAMAAGRGVPVAVLVGKVWENVILFRQASGAILGEQQRLLDLISAESDFSALISIKW